jgi:hypothetical protein
MMSPNIIYGLFCPKTNELHYVGKSSNYLERPKQHLTRSHSYKINQWTNDLKEIGLKPVIKILEEVEFIENLTEREMYWIQKSIDEGCYLFNIHRNSSFKLRKSLRELIAEELKNNPPSTTPYKQLADFIIQQRTAANLTPEQLATRSGLAIGFIHEIERGKDRMIKFEKTQQLLNFFGAKMIFNGHTGQINFENNTN